MIENMKWLMYIEKKDYLHIYQNKILNSQLKKTCKTFSTIEIKRIVTDLKIE